MPKLFEEALADLVNEYKNHGTDLDYMIDSLDMVKQSLEEEE